MSQHTMTSFEESAAKHVQLIDEDEEQGRGGAMRHHSYAVESRWAQPISNGFLSRPLVAAAVIFFTFLNFVLSVVALSKTNAQLSTTTTQSTTKSSGLASHGIDCSNSEDMLFGSEVHSFGDHHYQIVGIGSNAPTGVGASLSFMDVLHDAEHRCYGGKNGQLATIESSAENAFLLNLLKADRYFSDGDTAWLGAGDMKREGRFEWFTKSLRTNGVAFWTGGTAIQGGQPVDNAYTNWHADEPNSNGEEDCVTMYGGNIGKTNGGFWNDVSCYHVSPYFLVEFGE